MYPSHGFSADINHWQWLHAPFDKWTYYYKIVIIKTMELAEDSTTPSDI